LVFYLGHDFDLASIILLEKISESLNIFSASRETHCYVRESVLGSKQRVIKILWCERRQIAMDAWQIHVSP